jgi:opacity protein-like surface antigen
MRRWLLAFCLVGFAPLANAADYEMPTLRGSTPFVPAPPTYFPWAGFYVGGHAAYSSSGMNLAGANEDLIAFILRETAIESEGRVSQWPLLGKATVSNGGFGGFVGYNTQWDNAVVGIDLTYTKSRLAGSSTDFIGRSFTTTNDYNNRVDVEGSAALTIKHFMTGRVRAGVAFGQFLPYLTFGAAVGIADYSRAVIVTTEGTYVGENDPPLPPYGPITTVRSSTKKNMVIYGYAGGLGLDVAFTPNLFARGEWEFIQFKSPTAIDAYVSTIRGAVGLKF